LGKTTATELQDFMADLLKEMGNRRLVVVGG
jgi:hypothetical protein